MKFYNAKVAGFVGIAFRYFVNEMLKILSEFPDPGYPTFHFFFDFHINGSR